MKIKYKKLIITKIFLYRTKFKEDITYFNYTFFQIDDLKKFFEFIGKDFEYVLIEESHPNYLSDPIIQKAIQTYVKENFLLKKVLFDEKKIFLTNQQAVIHYYNNTISRYDIVENINNDNLEIIYGLNYSYINEMKKTINIKFLIQ